MPTKKKPATPQATSPVAPVKSVSKKKMKKSIPKSSVQKKTKPMAAMDAPVLMEETEVHKPNHTVEIHRKFVLVGVCSNCHHMPMRANKLVALLSLALLILSGMIIFDTAPESLDLTFGFQAEPVQMDRSSDR